MIDAFLSLPYWQQMLVVCAVLFIALLCAGIASAIPGRLQSSNVAKSGQESGKIPQWPPEPYVKQTYCDREGTPVQPTSPVSMIEDPLHLMPEVIHPILFEDGHRVTPEEIHAQGLCFLVDADGRIVSVMTLDAGKPGIPRTVEDWCGANHGARIS
jgi:hypothetical protein